MKKNGFTIIETVITVVVLSTSLLYLYSSYSSIISSEKERLYYDDIAHIYKSHYIKEYLLDYADMDMAKKERLNDSYIITIGEETENLFYKEDDAKGLTNIKKTFNVTQLLLVKSDMITKCEDTEKGDCGTAWNYLDIYQKAYIKTLNEASSTGYYLVVEYAEKYDKDKQKMVSCVVEDFENCSVFYASIEI